LGRYGGVEVVVPQPRSPDEVANAIEEHLRGLGRVSEANLGHMLRRVVPEFRPGLYGLRTLREFLDVHVGGALPVDQLGGDTIWALAAQLDDRQLTRALAAPSGQPVAVGEGPAVGRLAELRVSAWRAARDEVRLPLGGLTALVGANGVGKSTLLLSLHELMAACRFSNPLKVFGGAAAAAGPRHRSAPPALLSALSVRSDTGQALGLTLREGEVTVELRAAAGDAPRSSTWAERAAGDWAVFSPAWRAFADGVLLLRLNPEALLEPAPVEKTTVDDDGFGLASALAHLANTDPAVRDEVIAAVQQINPQVEAVRQIVHQVVHPVAHPVFAQGARIGAEGGAAPGVAYRLEVKLRGVGWLPARMLSEGTLLALGVHTALRGNKPRLLLLDDIDRGLHPRAQRELAAQLRQWVDGGAQVLTTTHSPIMLDALSPESVVVVRGGSAGAQVARLTDHPEWSAWSGSMRPGEFWTWVGEDWLDLPAAAR
jgi:ABC-type branched-subunit amino acid transport system ATPase component